MQLKKHKSIHGALAMATCTLISAAPGVARSADAAGDWSADSALLVYSETDRVTIVEPVVNIKKQIGEDEYLSTKIVLDAMTGASPNGATATDQPQTFTSPSGNQYVVPAGETPLRSFRDQRGAVSVAWDKPLDRMVRGIFDASLSVETDYISRGASAQLNWDVNDRLTTLSGGLSYYADSVKPESGAPIGLATVGTGTAGGDAANSKNATELLLGVTQVVNRRTLMQLNFTHNASSGYLTDPYKIVSVVDGTTGSTVDYRYEKRPDTRARDAIFWKFVYHLPQDVVHFSYRYLRDDWGITAHTADIKYRYELGGGDYMQPHVRYSVQTAADFYRHSLVSGAALPSYASADYRLGAMTTTTAGLKYGWVAGKRADWSARVEYMLQSGESHPGDAIGIQRSQNLFPDVSAWIVQLSYSTQF